jgi:hypothetical protein
MPHDVMLGMLRVECMPMPSRTLKAFSAGGCSFRAQTRAITAFTHSTEGAASHGVSGCVVHHVGPGLWLPRFNELNLKLQTESWSV